MRPHFKLVGFCILAVISACAPAPQKDSASNRFTIAVIPDTQNYTDFTHQQSAGFKLDAADLFIQQMQYIANNGVSNGGDIAFVASVGDVWQHQSLSIDADHANRGIQGHQSLSATLRAYLGPKKQTLEFEIPKAIEGYQYVSDAGIPFGVAPGNHDYDAMWSVRDFEPDYSKMSKEMQGFAKAVGTLHVGGLANFKRAFGAQTSFFADKPWYVNSYNGGTSSAQIFTAGNYQFLHIAIEMQPSDEVIAWAKLVLAQYPNVPTIFSTHDYLNTQGQRLANPIVDLAAADPKGNNSPQQMWDKLFSQHDQIFLVLCGHQHGQNRRVDANINGLPVHQVLADYQDRGQVGIDAGVEINPYIGKPTGIGDGWFRLMSFDLNAEAPKISVRTYSSHYKKYSGQEPNYANWYKHIEQPQLSDAQFYAGDEFEIDLTGFHQRFKKARQK